MQNTIKILVDLKKETYRFDQAQQGDDVILDITLLENGLAKDITGETVELIYINANNTVASVTGDKIVVSGNNVKITCPTDCTRSYGIAKFQLKIINTYQVSTFPIALTIVPGVDQGQQISQNISTILEQLTSKNIECNETLESLKAWINTGNLLNTDLENNIATGTQLDADLESGIATGMQVKTVLGNVIDTGNSLSESLEDVINVGNALDTTLKADAEIANTAKTNLENVIETADTTTYATQGQVTEINSQLAEKAKQVDLVATNARISDIIANNGNGDKDVELVDARKGETTLRDKIDKIDLDISDAMQQTGTIDINIKKDCYIVLNKNIGETIDVVNTVSYQGFNCSVTECKQGEFFTINGRGGATPRLFGFTDKNYKLLYSAQDGVSLTNHVVQAPSDGFLIVNDNTNSKSYKGKYSKSSIDIVETMIKNGLVEKLSFNAIGNYIDTSSDTVDINSIIKTSDTWNYSVTKCEYRDVFVVSGKGGGVPRLWAFVDENNKIISRADIGISGTFKIIAPKKTAYLVVNTVSSYEDCYKLYSTKDIYENLKITGRNQYIRTGIGEIGTQIEKLKPVSMTPINFDGMNYIIEPCEVGDVFRINGKGGGYGRLWAFLNSDNLLLDSSITSVDAKNIRIVAPPGSAKLIINTSTIDRICYKVYESIKKPSTPVVITTPMPSKVYNYNGDLKAINTDGATITLSEDWINSLGVNRVNKMYELYDKLVELYPRFIRKEVLGKDASNTYEIRCYTVEPFWGNTNPKILFMSNIHGGEMPPQLSTYFIAKELLEQRNSDNMIGYIFRNSCIKIIPFANPYGVAINNGINVNNVNPNRNFDGDWIKTVDANLTVGTAGESPFDQAETQILRDFILKNRDAIFAINQHTSSRISELDELCYVVDNYVADRSVMQGLFNVMDYNLKEQYSWIRNVDKYNYKNLLRINDTETHGGTMNKWFNSIGVRGCLLEIAKGAGSNWDNEHSNDIIKIFIDIAVNLMGVMIGSIPIRSGNEQTNHIRNLLN